MHNVQFVMLKYRGRFAHVHDKSLPMDIFDIYGP